MTKKLFTDFSLSSKNTITPIKTLSGNFLEIPVKSLGGSRLLDHLIQDCREICIFEIDFKDESSYHVIFWEHIGINYHDIYNLPYTLSYAEKTEKMLVIDDSYEGLLTNTKVSEINNIFKDSGIEILIVSSNYKLNVKNAYYYNVNLVMKNYDNIRPQKDPFVDNIAPRTKKFLCLNRQQRLHRLQIVDFLLEKNIQNHSYISCGDQELASAISDKDDFPEEIYNIYKNNPVMDFALAQRVLPPESSKRLQDNLPLMLDLESGDMEEKEIKKHAPNLETYFRDSYWSIITEGDFYSGEFIGYTEKVLKCFLYKHPFIVAGAPYTLEMLQELGFLTFSCVIDESYDRIEDNDLRLDAIKKEMIKLFNLNYVEHYNLYHSINKILTHNRAHYIAINNQHKPTSIINTILTWYYQ